MKPSSIPNECRTCLKQDVSFKSIFSMDERSDVMITYANIINMSISSLLHISEEDGLSDKICSSCAQKVLEFYKFKSGIETNHLLLKSRTTNSNGNITAVTNGVWLKEENLDWDDGVQKTNVNCDMAYDTKNPLEDTNEGAEYLIKEESLDLEDVKIEKGYENNYELYNTDNSRTFVESVEDEVMREDGVSLNEECIMTDSDYDMDYNPSLNLETEEEIANNASTKSLKIYQNSYERFIKWCDEKKELKFTENVLLAYFADMDKTMKWRSSTKWSHYSMIKSLLKINKGVDINKYLKLRDYLKKQNDGCIPRQSNILTKQQFDTFLTEAPDKKFLDLKIVLLIGVAGGCLCKELEKLEIDDIQDFGSLLHITIPIMRTKYRRHFTIMGEHFLKIYRKYISLRPKDMKSKSFFIKYSNGMCFPQVMGRHKIGRVARKVATYLQLPNPYEYSGYCFKRTSNILHHIDWGDDFTTNKISNEPMSIPKKYIEQQTKDEAHKKILIKNNELLDLPLPPLIPIKPTIKSLNTAHSSVLNNKFFWANTSGTNNRKKSILNRTITIPQNINLLEHLLRKN